MPALTFEEARRCVMTRVSQHVPRRAVETVPLHECAGRVLAADISADRDYPPLPRSARDGFAVRAGDLPGRLTIAGEVRAGDRFGGHVRPGQAVEIMTGAPVPDGADAVVMVEHTTVEGSTVSIERGASPGENIVPRGSEAARGAVVLHAGARTGYAEAAMLAATGQVQIPVYARPRVAILSTGDEIVQPGEPCAKYQIRNSNAFALAVQVERAGGTAEILPVARDTLEATAPLLERGLEADLLLISGGVSAGRYDVVEPALAALGAEFFFTRVLIQPGQPLVFGRVRERFFFGLPGNPASTMVCFELFARAAVELLSGQREVRLPFTTATLTDSFRQRPGLTRFLPAVVADGAAQVTPVRWAGSGDIAAQCRANAYIVTEPQRESWQSGESIRVMLKS